MISVNEYFDGNVKSLGHAVNGQKVTVGVMEEGTYEFGTAAPERMSVILGELYAQLAGETEFTAYTAGQAFEVPGDSKFAVRSVGQSSYLCEFL